MNFAFTEEQQMFRDMFADFVAKEVEPLAEHISEHEEIPKALLKKAAMQGFLGALLPEEYGGAALDMVSYILLLEEVAKSDMSTAMVLHVHNDLVSRAILLCGSAEQKEQWLPAMAEGSVIGAWAFAEPDPAGLTNLQVMARAADDGYVLHGTKTWVSNAGIAGLMVVFAQAPEGPTALLVPADAAGLKLGQRDKTLGMRGVQIHPVYFNDVAVPADAVLGRPGDAQAVMAAVGDFSRLAMAAIALGGAEHALSLGVDFAKERKQFGVEIARKGAIQAYIADSAVEVETLRSQVYRCASLADQGLLDGLSASIAKLWANRVSYQVANRMIQTHGGYGYILDYAIGRVFRDCRTVEGIEGSNRTQQAAIARSVLAAHGFVM
ncbi:MAG: acyl-CoA dehydrogenase family protein [Caldilineales bacterium]|nr:acyl-CoA dehydrogenase family protein [Caldilineales bacterium]MDW8316232.1 acyl-CoA dehydrogenase family protein [Anaerolineae bacterium]